MCGSQGAAAVNAVVSEAVERLGGRRDLAVYHVVGDRFLAGAAPGRDGADGILYRVIGYEDRMPLLYAAADLLVTRGGAGTIAELSTVGAPALIVPWPDAAENHQLDNAKVLSDQGAALLVEQADLTADRLIAEIESFLREPGRLAMMAHRAYEAGAVHRSGALVAAVQRVAAP
jgi:UDP-N-acetylglucosamine--N-acetylmuramyl-(pentapeptide) pyrophosphoryl-undecaprenol N-acetylglucosamine transferase